MENEDKKKPIKVFARVRPLNDEEVERGEKISVETFEDIRKIKIMDEKHSQETTYFFDGVFSGEESNEIVFQNTTRHLITELLNGMNCAVLTYGQTGSGKTFTLMADGCITEYAIKELFEKIEADKIHKYKVYLEKVYDLLGIDNKTELPVREHPKKGVYVSNLSHHQANTAAEVFYLLEKGKQELVTAETRMVRQSSRSHSIFQLSIERRLDITKKKLYIASGDEEIATTPSTEVPHLCVPDDIVVIEEDVVLSGKMDICDLAGSERLGKTMVEGINRSEARYINSSLLELGNVIYALSEGRKRHIPFRNSTLTRLLQECLGSRCQTSFIVCIAPSASEAYETRCSLNFGTRARTITNKERMSMNVEVDYKILAKKLTRKIELLENELKISRPIRNFISSSLQNLNNSVAIQTEFGFETILNDNNSLQSSSGFFHHSLKMSQMLEILIENMEVRNQQQPQKQQQQQQRKDISKPPAITVLNDGIERIETIYISLVQDIMDETICDKINNIIENWLKKIEEIKEELELLNKKEDTFIDLFNEETTYVITEGCSDMENMILKMVQYYVNNKEDDADEQNDNEEVQTRYALFDGLLNNMISGDTFVGNEREVGYINQLLNALEVLQIIRLLMESSKLAFQDNNTSPENKSYICSSSVEEETSSDVDYTSNEDPYFSGITKIEQDDDFLRSDINKERMNPPFQVKLSRSRTFKMKPDINQLTANHTDALRSPVADFLNQYENDYLPGYVPILSRRRGKVHSIDYPKIKRFVVDNDEDHISINPNTADQEQLKTELIHLEKRYEELSNKYTDVVEERDTINQKLNNSKQDKLILISERDNAQQQLEMQAEQHDGNSSSDHSDAFFPTLNPYTKVNQMNDESAFLLEEKEEEIKQLERENQRLLQLIENGRLSEIFDQSTEEQEDKAEGDDLKEDDIDVTDVIEELLALCNNLDVLAYQDSVRKSVSNIEDINQLESELFNMIEKSTKYEQCLLEFRTKLHQVLHLTNETTDTTEVTVQAKATKKPAGKVILSKITSKMPNHVSKKIMCMKKVQRKRLEELRKSYIQQPVSMAKEIKASRASRVKELVQEKLLLNDHLEMLEKSLSEKDIEVRESKKQIDLLITELGHLDIELTRKHPNTPLLTREKTTLNNERNRSEKKTVTIRMPVCQNGQNEALQGNFKTTQHSSNINSREDTVPVSEFESMKLEAETYRRKYRDLERMYEESKDNNEERDLLKQNLTLKRKIEFLEETNAALLTEIKTIKSINQDRKTKIHELRERNNSLIEELEHYKRQTIQTQAKNDNMKIKLEKRLAKFKEKTCTLENRSLKLQNEIHVLVKNKTFNDSGIANSLDED